MGYSDFFQSASDDFHNQGSYTHDAIGGLLAYEAAKKYEEHIAANGKPDNHAQAKEVLAGFIGAAATQLAETKGRDLWDEHKRRAAIQNAEQRIGERVLSQDYSGDY